MRDNIIRMHVMDTTSIAVRTDAYEFRPVGRLAFLQKWMWKLLHKMQVLHTYHAMEETVKIIEVNEKNFTDRLLKYYRQCFPWGKRPSKVYMGIDEFNELASQSYDSLSRVGFNIDIRMNWERTVFNLPIEVIPEMKGVLIV